MSLKQLLLNLIFDADREGRRARRRKKEAGFTLTELMVVIFIIGLLATVVMVNVLPSQDKAMVVKAKADIATLETALEQYRLDNLSYPTTSDGLSALTSAPPSLAQPERYRRGGYIRRLPQDPWGRPYQYQAPAPGGTEENADIRGDG